MGIDPKLRGIFLLVPTMVLIGCVSTDLAQGVSPAAIKSIELGMPIESVVHIMGLPYAIEAAIHQQHLIECPRPLPSLRFEPSDASSISLRIDSALRSPESCCTGELEERSRRFTMEYSRMSGPWEISPMVNVRFDESHRVTQIYASVISHSSFREDEYVYLLSTDPLDSAATYSTGNYYCDDRLLEKYFGN